MTNGLLKKMSKNNHEGFTLIELMIVVAIIGILAAIAIPNFLTYQLKSKTAEAKTNLGAIKTSQEAFKAEWDGYIPCANTISPVNATKQAWPVPAAGFDAIGFAPSANTYYSYTVGVAAGTAIANIGGSGLGGQSHSFCITAHADLDGDGTGLINVATNGEFGFSNTLAADGAGVASVVSTPSVTGTVTQAGAVQDLNPGVY